MGFLLPSLQFGPNELNPVLSEQTISVHHGKHHAAYVNNLNNLIAGTDFDGKDLEQIIKESDGGIFNNAAQIWNHTFYFEQFSGKERQESPSGALLLQMEKQWGTFDDFKVQFNAAAMGLFGSGWVWLVRDEKGALAIVKEPNAGNPMTRQLSPVLTFDVWEHAYYLDYQNRRNDYVNALWHIIDWKVVERRFGS